MKDKKQKSYKFAYIVVGGKVDIDFLDIFTNALEDGYEIISTTVVEKMIHYILKKEI